ncbi:MAG: BatA domain-containing protein [bacterium]
MLNFLSPGSLFALAAIAIPIAIHLFNKKEGKRVKVGSTRFLRASQSNRLKRIRLSQIPLLVLRSLILTLLAFMLAEPFWVREGDGKNSHSGWVLVSPAVLTSPLDAMMRGKVDSLIAAGNELRLLADGFPTVSPQDSVTDSSLDGNYWSLLREADRTAPANVPFWVMTASRLANFRGERPAIRDNVTWVAVNRPGRSRWLEKAESTAGDSLRVVVGVGDSTQTHFRRYFFKRPRKKTMVVLTDFALEMEPDDREVIHIRLLTDASQRLKDHLTVTDANRTKKFLIYHDKSRQEDARYVKAALQAIIAAARQAGSVSVLTIDRLPNRVDDADWIFWLSRTGLPETLLTNQTGRVILRDAYSPEYTAVETEIIVEDEPVARPPRLHRRVAALDAGVALWKDGSGEPLLEIQQQAGGLLMHFDSRFHPLWNDLVLSPVFPKWLGDLIDYAERTMKADGWGKRDFDQRFIATRQIEPEKLEPRVSGKPAGARRALDVFFWGAAVLLFALERVVSDNEN